MTWSCIYLHGNRSNDSYLVSILGRCIRHVILGFLRVEVSSLAVTLDGGLCGRDIYHSVVSTDIYKSRKEDHSPDVSVYMIPVFHAGPQWMLVDILSENFHHCTVICCVITCNPSNLQNEVRL